MEFDRAKKSNLNGHIEKVTGACYKKIRYVFSTGKVLTKERQDQLKKLNSNVRGLCNGPCTHGECVRACVRAYVRVCVRACTL